MENSNVEAYLNRYEYTQAFKAKVVLEVVYQGKPIQKAVEEYDLPSTYTLQMWIRQFQKQLENGMIVLPPMTEQQKADLKASEQRIKELEKALESCKCGHIQLKSSDRLRRKRVAGSYKKKGWYQTVKLIKEKELVKMNVGRLCTPVW